MASLPDTIALPLHKDADGVLRVGGTRVTLDSVIGAYREGMTAEEIAQQYSSVPLADLYEVLGYYLRHQVELDEYLVQRRANADRIRTDYEAQHDPRGLRQQLLARRSAQGH
jgi:uncharacterized protein (DUF433 family)